MTDAPDATPANPGPLVHGEPDEAPARPRGRPPKVLDAEAFDRLLLGLAARTCSFAQACERAGTSAYVVKQSMKLNTRVDFMVRVACASFCRKRLADGGADPDLLIEVGREVELINAGDERRTWEEVERKIADRRGIRAAQEAFRRPVVIPEAKTPDEENF